MWPLRSAWHFLECPALETANPQPPLIPLWMPGLSAVPGSLGAVCGARSPALETANPRPPLIPLWMPGLSAVPGSLGAVCGARSPALETAKTPAAFERADPTSRQPCTVSTHSGADRSPQCRAPDTANPRRRLISLQDAGDAPRKATGKLRGTAGPPARPFGGSSRPPLQPPTYPGRTRLDLRPSVVELNRGVPARRSGGDQVGGQQAIPRIRQPGEGGPPDGAQQP